MTTSPKHIPIEDVLDPILLGDPVLQQLNTLDELTVPRLMDLTGDPLRSVNSSYKTELFIHLSYLMDTYPDMSPQQLADTIGMHKDNLNRNILKYNLPRSFKRYQHKIKARKLKKQMNEVADYVYTIHKIDFLYQIHQDRKQGNNLKEVAKLSDLPYQKTRDWFKQYQLANFTVQPPTTPKLSRSSHNLPVSNSNQSLTVTIHPTTRLFTAEGTVIRASDLLQDASLMNTRFVQLSPSNEVVLGRITSAKPTGRISSRMVTTRAGSSVIIEIKNRVIADLDEGLLPVQPDLLKEKKDAIMAIRSFSQLSSTTPSLFSLIRPLDGQPEIEFVLRDDIRAAINTRLEDRFGSLKKFAEDNNLPYKRGVAGKGLTHRILRVIHKELNYPDIHHPDFFSDVETIRYKIQGGRAISVDTFVLETDLLYILGLIASDGYGSKKRRANLGFNNAVFKLVDTFKSIIIKYFPELTTNIRPMTDHRSTYELSINHYAIRLLMNNLQIKGDEHHFNEDDAYLPIFELEQELIVAFLQGLFDGDGTVDAGATKVGIAVFHPERAKNTALLLKRLGIDCWIFYSEQKQLTPPGNTEPSDSDQWNVYISGKKDLLKFMDLISSHHPDKIKKLEQMKNKLEQSNSLSSKYNLAPKRAAVLFKKLRQDAGITQSSLGSSGTISSIENLKSRTSIHNMQIYLNRAVQQGASTTSREYQELERLLKKTYNLEPVEKVSQLTTKEMVEIQTDLPLVTDTGIVLQ